MGLASLWFEIHEGDSNDFFLKSAKPYAIAATAIWSFVATATLSWIASIGAESEAELNQRIRSLLRLIGNVRLIVTAKSRRFYDVLTGEAGPANAEQVFTTITRPDMQIREIVRAIYDYYKHFSPEDIDISVTVMRWDQSAGHLVFLDYFPDSDAPSTPPAIFKDRSTVAGRSFFDKNLVICEDALIDTLFHRFSDTKPGSMFSYPVVDASRDTVEFVINVWADRGKHFLQNQRDVIKFAMDVFADRLVLESRLTAIRELVEGGVTNVQIKRQG